MPDLPYVDSEAGARSWANELDLGFASNKVFFAKPRGETIPRAWVEVKLVDTGVEPEIVPVADFNLQWDVCARKKGDAYAVTQKLELAVKLLRCGSPFGDDAAVVGTEIVLGPLWHPDEDGGFARYVIGTLLKLRPVTVAA